MSVLIGDIGSDIIPMGKSRVYIKNADSSDDGGDLRSFLRRHVINKKLFAEDAGLSEAGFFKILNRGTAHDSTLERIQNSLNINLRDKSLKATLGRDDNGVYFDISPLEEANNIIAAKQPDSGTLTALISEIMSDEDLTEEEREDVLKLIVGQSDKYHQTLFDLYKILKGKK